MPWTESDFLDAETVMADESVPLETRKAVAQKFKAEYDSRAVAAETAFPDAPVAEVDPFPGAPRAETSAPQGPGWNPEGGGASLEEVSSRQEAPAIASGAVDMGRRALEAAPNLPGIAGPIASGAIGLGKGALSAAHAVDQGLGNVGTGMIDAMTMGQIPRVAGMVDNVRRGGQLPDIASPGDLVGMNPADVVSMPERTEPAPGEMPLQDYMRRALRGSEDEAPMSNMVGQAIGSALNPVNKFLPSGKMQQASRLARVGVGAAEDAALSAIEAEGQGRDPLSSAITGGVLGGAFRGAGEGVSAGLDMLKRRGGQGMDLLETGLEKGSRKLKAQESARRAEQGRWAKQMALDPEAQAKVAELEARKAAALEARKANDAFKATSRSESAKKGLETRRLNKEDVEIAKLSQQVAPEQRRIIAAQRLEEAFQDGPAGEGARKALTEGADKAPRQLIQAIEERTTKAVKGLDALMESTTVRAKTRGMEADLAKDFGTGARAQKAAIAKHLNDLTTVMGSQLAALGTEIKKDFPTAAKLREQAFSLSGKDDIGDMFLALDNLKRELGTRGMRMKPGSAQFEEVWGLYNEVASTLTDPNLWGKRISARQVELNGAWNTFLRNRAAWDNKFTTGLGGGIGGAELKAAKQADAGSLQNVLNASDEAAYQVDGAFRDGLAQRKKMLQAMSDHYDLGPADKKQISAWTQQLDEADALYTQRRNQREVAVLADEALERTPDHENLIPIGQLPWLRNYRLLRNPALAPDPTAPSRMRDMKTEDARRALGIPDRETRMKQAIGGVRNMADRAYGVVRATGAAITPKASTASRSLTREIESERVQKQDDMARDPRTLDRLSGRARGK